VQLCLFYVSTDFRFRFFYDMLQVDIPRGSQYGDFLRLENFGFPVLYGGDAKGDQLVHLVSEQDSD
jgi:DnaJ-class molecular chaperone